MPKGNYCVTVTDANGCTTSTCVTIPQKPGPVATHSSMDEICQMKNGTATAVPSGGVPPYIYSWSNGENTQTATGLSKGNYTYTVTDQGGCSTSGTVYVGEIPGPTAYFMYTPKILTILEGPVYFWDESTVVHHLIHTNGILEMLHPVPAHIMFILTRIWGHILLQKLLRIAMAARILS